MSNEVHLLHIRLVIEHDLARGHDSAEHGDDQLIDKASLAVVKEVVERLFELHEDSGVLDHISLHLRGELVVEWELFDHKVEIVQESLLNISPDVVVECWLDVVWLIRLFNFLDPHIKRVKLLLDESLKRVSGVENTVD